MGSAFFYRLIAFLVLAAAAAALFLFSGTEEIEAFPSKETKASEVLPGEMILPAAAADLSGGKPASDAAGTRIPAENASGGENPDHAGRLASAMAAARRNASGNQPAAQGRTGEQAQDVLQKLMEEQARKDALPLNSPFGENRPEDRSR